MKKNLIVLSLIFLILILSGCWSKRELNDLALVAALGIDFIDGEYAISVQVIDPSQVSLKSANGQAPVVTYHAEGKTVFEAVRKILALSPRKLYFAHLQLVVVGEELADKGIRDSVDFLARDQEIRNDFTIIVSQQATAKDVLNVLTPIEKIPASRMLNSLKITQDAWGSTLEVDVEDLVTDLGVNDQYFVLSAIEVLGDKTLGIDQTNVERIETPVKLKFTGLAIFKEDKLLGYIDEYNSKSFSYLNDNIKSTIEIISCPSDGELTTEITQSKTKTKGIFKDGQPTININIDIVQNVAEVKCDIDLTDIKTIDWINNQTEKHIKKNTNQVLNIFQENYQADVLGFGEAIHRANPTEWRKIKDDWQTIYPEVEVNVKVNVYTRGLGTLQNSKLKE
ncbi:MULTISPECIES: Ger(x)C family spore germination protein [Lysinibacillus]|uniref:Spore germination protein KC n=1 Tax=Lysinibacillus fusiformis TaxID=28031 RepID=A0A1H9AN78_9BACI|nr:Ger(x)C family spore germination protein [Lysinibacillus fusiformis]MCG7436044.1 Ger(x)C family spore germination protein [Lysinibacillus fusiformis]SCX42644.1 spore germination protein KC [Lysinibacillus fusiformis]SCX83584.1 spore germination protein KC [Lysinibacillus fusiformis]SDB12540.1 spore germination protein KC [Lysinibacillus fusiformis]SEM78739.1 spore germination protein KC [Lysinibacillus fusiformis]